MTEVNKIICGDTLTELNKMPDEFVDTIVTSPPYWGLRDYGIKGQIGLEPTLKEYIDKLLTITQELKRVLKPTGVMFWDHGDSYQSTAPGTQNTPATGLGRKTSKAQGGSYRFKTEWSAKCLYLQNYRLVLRMIDEQDWILRNIIIWNKPNHMPSSVKDRFANSYEPVFMLVKKQKYWFDLDSVREPYTFNRWGGKYKTNEDVKTKPGEKRAGGQGSLNRMDYDCYPHSGKNPGDLWTIPTQPFPEAHFATFPEKLVEPMIKAGCPEWICKKCGKARVRITEPTEEYAKRLGKSWHDHQNDMTIGAGQKNDGGAYASYKTLGWTDCGCRAGWRPGIVLDPFSGAATTCVVAKGLGRSYLGIELSSDYIKIAEKRLLNTMGRLL